MRDAYDLPAAAADDVTVNNGRGDDVYQRDRRGTEHDDGDRSRRACRRRPPPPDHTTYSRRPASPDGRGDVLAAGRNAGRPGVRLSAEGGAVESVASTQTQVEQGEGSTGRHRRVPICVQPVATQVKRRHVIYGHDTIDMLWVQGLNWGGGDPTGCEIRRLLFEIHHL